MSKPNREKSVRSYRQLADIYDRKADKGKLARRLAVRQLHLARGDTVIDVCSGTGLNFALLESAVGPTGRIIAVDHSHEMLAKAKTRAATQPWENIAFLETSVEDVVISTTVDAALFCRAHDVLRTPAALDRILGHVRPDGRVVALGSKWAPHWNVPLNLIVLALRSPLHHHLRGLRPSVEPPRSSSARRSRLDRTTQGGLRRLGCAAVTTAHSTRSSLRRATLPSVDPTKGGGRLLFLADAPASRSSR